MTDSENRAVELLGNLGFSPQEAKAYIALLQSGPATPYRIAKDVGIPAGKIYDVVQRLSVRGLVTEVSGGDGGLVAKDADSALKEIADRYRRTVEAASASLKSLQPRRTHNVAWNVEGEEEVLLCGRRIIERAEQSLAIAAPPALLEKWLDASDIGGRRKLDARLFSIERPSNLPSSWRWRRLTPANSTRVLKDGAVVTADGRVVFFVSANATTATYRGSWTETPAIVAMAADYIASLAFIEDVFDNQWIPWGDI